MRIVFQTLTLIALTLRGLPTEADVWEFHEDGEVSFHAAPRSDHDQSAHEILVSRRRVEFAPMVEFAAEECDVDPDLIHAMIEVESAYDATARSEADAFGLMQLLAGTAERFGVEDRSNPQENILGGARYLRWLLDEFDGRETLAIAAYHAGENRVRGRNGRGARVPAIPSTQEHVRRVRAALDRLRGAPTMLVYSEVSPSATPAGAQALVPEVATIATGGSR